MLNLQNLKREKQTITSIQSMLKNFTDSIDLSSNKMDRLKFQSLYKKYKSLYLDFLEKESGTTHIRDIDKIETKGKVDRDNKVAESLLKSGEQSPQQSGSSN